MDVATSHVGVNEPTGHIDVLHFIPLGISCLHSTCDGSSYGIHTCCSHRAVVVYEH